MQITAYFLLLTETTRLQQSGTFSGPQFITCFLSTHEKRMMNIPISSCFYKRSHNFCEWEHASRFLHRITQTLPNENSGCVNGWLTVASQEGENSWLSTEIHRLQRHIVDCVIARGRGGKGQDSKVISQCDLHLKSEHEIWTRCSVRRQWMGNWLFFTECGMCRLKQGEFRGEWKFLRNYSEDIWNSLLFL